MYPGRFWKYIGEPINNWKSVVSYSRNHDIPFILNPKKKIVPEVIEKVISFFSNLLVYNIIT